MARKSYIPISVTTVKNGYALSFSNKDYLYFNLVNLLEGMLFHIGLKEINYASQEEIKAMLATIKAWKPQTKTQYKMKKEMERLSSKLHDAEEKLAWQAAEIKALKERLTHETTPKKCKARTGRPRSTAANSQRAALIRDWREHHPYSHNKSECARELGLSRASVAKWWDGDTGASAENTRERTSKNNTESNESKE